MTRCPTCRAPLPPIKTCARETCGKPFYRGEGGRSDAAYCTQACADAERARRYRQRRKAAAVTMPPGEQS